MSSASPQPAWLPPQPVQEVKKAGIIEDSMSYEERLFHYTYATRNNDMHFLEYRLLQRMNLVRLQNKLARLKGSCWAQTKASETDWDELKGALNDYTNAIRDFAFWRSLSDIPRSQASERQRGLSQAFPGISNLEGSPFNSRYCSLPSPGGIPSDPIRSFLSHVLPRSLTYTKGEMDARFDEYLEGHDPITISPFVDRLARFLIAFTGGAALVVPMLIMSLPSSDRTKSLITVSVTVTLFASLLSIGIRASNSETLIATATYAAVLVVFVGSSS